MPYVPNKLLDLSPEVGQVTQAVRFDVCTIGGQAKIGEVYPVREGVTLSNDSGGQIKRTLSGLVLKPNDAHDINVIADRICPTLVLEDGTEWPMGTLMFPEPDITVGTLGNTLSATMYDERQMLNLGIPDPFGLATGAKITDALETLVAGGGVIEAEIERSEWARVGDAVSWPAGTPRLVIIDELCELASYHPLYFDNQGVLIGRPIDFAQPRDHIYVLGPASRIVRESLKYRDNRVTAPNVFIAINTGSDDAEISGRYEVPDGEPNSVYETGREIVEVIPTQGIANTDAAENIARARANEVSANLRSVTFSTNLDPRHDTFDVVELDGEFFRELSWQMDLRSGGVMTHVLGGQL